MDPPQNSNSTLVRRFLGCPEEVLQYILSYLGAADLGELRLACKSLSVAIFPYFASRFFSRVRAVCDPGFVDVLVEISESRLALFVEQVCLKLKGDDYGILASTI